MKQVKFSDLSVDYRMLLAAAEDAREKAYNPYSHFFVGAAILGINNELIQGANVENASYGLTICAERSAIFRANAMDIRQFKAIAISCRGETFDTDEPTVSCGACRQVINEFAQISGRDIELILSNTQRTKIILVNISELLPGAFGPSDLGIDLARYRKS